MLRAREAFLEDLRRGLRVRFRRASNERRLRASRMIVPPPAFDPQVVLNVTEN